MRVTDLSWMKYVLYTFFTSLIQNDKEYLAKDLRGLRAYFHFSQQYFSVLFLPRWSAA